MADAASGAGGAADKRKEDGGMEEEEQEQARKPTGEQGKEAAAMAAMAGDDSADGVEVDKAKIDEVMQTLNTKLADKAKSESLRAKVLSAVTVSTEDIALVADAAELSAKEAEAALREAAGSTEVALARLAGVEVVGSHTG